MAEGGKREEGVRQLKYVRKLRGSARSSWVDARKGPRKRRRKKARMQVPRMMMKRNGRIVATVAGWKSQYGV